MIIRNDDVAVDTDLDHFRRFCGMCDRYGVRLIQAITPCGATKPIAASMDNERIRKLLDKWLPDSSRLVEYLQSRNDDYAVHGLWHTHRPNVVEIAISKLILTYLGLTPTYFVPPFNEGDYGSQVLGLTVLQRIERLEDFLSAGTPSQEIVYLHSWRFDGSYYQLEDLERCLERTLGTTSS